MIRIILECYPWNKPRRHLKAAWDFELASSRTFEWRLWLIGPGLEQRLGKDGSLLYLDTFSASGETWQTSLPPGDVPTLYSKLTILHFEFLVSPLHTCNATHLLLYYDPRRISCFHWTEVTVRRISISPKLASWPAHGQWIMFIKRIENRAEMQQNTD